MPEHTDPPTVDELASLKGRLSPATLLIFRNAKTCVAYGQDAVKLWAVLGCELTLTTGVVPSFSFPASDLETTLAKIVATDMRAAVLDRVPGEAVLGQQVERIVTPGRIE